MDKTKTGKQTVLHVNCPTCETHIIADEQGNVIQHFYEPDEKKAQDKVDDILDEDSKTESGEKDAGEETVSETKKEELEKETEENDSSEDTENDEFGLGNW